MDTNDQISFKLQINEALRHILVISTAFNYMN